MFFLTSSKGEFYPKLLDGPGLGRKNQNIHVTAFLETFLLFQVLLNVGRELRMQMKSSRWKLLWCTLTCLSFADLATCIVK